MRVTILNGNPDVQDRQFEDYLRQLAQLLEADQHPIKVLHLRDMDIRYCTGCFGCWVKTPGECVTPDDGEELCRAVINSDFVLWASPLRMGFPSALLKKAMDRSIPLIHPYFVVDHNEAHHRARYDRYPIFGLLLAREGSIDDEDIRIVTGILGRTALNLKSRLAFAALTDQPVQDLARAITTAASTDIAFDPQPRAIGGVRVAPPARLTVFNGSPRGAKGNTPLLLEHFNKGFLADPVRSCETFHLNHIKDTDRFQEAFGQAECVLLGFPLYTDAMPGQVKAFIESLEPFRGRSGNPPIAFLVQSGFPEAAHSRHVERYLERLAARLGSPYLGTMIKGGCEGIQSMPDAMTRKLYATLFQIGETFGQTGQLDPTLLRNLAKPERYPSYLAPAFKLLVRTPLASFYWDGQLREHGAFERRFAAPFRE